MIQLHINEVYGSVKGKKFKSARWIRPQCGGNCKRKARIKLKILVRYGEGPLFIQRGNTAIDFSN